MLENIGIIDSAVVAFVGYAVVFFGLILLMIVVIAMGKVFTAKKEVPAQVSEATPVAAADPSVAPGSAGELKLHDVSPKTAAMLMAIVANKMGKPLNELRFISIKEVK